MRDDINDYKNIDDDIAYENKNSIWLDNSDSKECESKMLEEMDQEDAIGDENRPLFNPASLTRKCFSYVPYPKEELRDVNLNFYSQKPQQTQPDLLQMFYRFFY
jgi:hypothetical protein